MSIENCYCTWDERHEHVILINKSCKIHYKPGGIVPTKDVSTVEFTTGAKRTKMDDDIRYDLIPTHSKRRLAKRYGLGDKNYPRYNWRKGIPFSNIINHVEEHLQHLKDTLRENYSYNPSIDDDAAAVAWGMFAIMEFQCEGRDALNDLFWAEKYGQGHSPEGGPENV